ncbi:MAG: hypothetical protein K2V38_09570 [Gemmataceae bacterium]|nr:hypothetical protein [Gemmataceae bacterium]
MNYRVVVRERVANNIASVTIPRLRNGIDGRGISRAADILLALSDNPTEQGESRAGAERVLIVPPLTAVFEVFEDTQTVLVYEAIYHPRQRL